MATIDQFGNTSDPLSAPALGGATGWAAAVRDAINGKAPASHLHADYLTPQEVVAGTNVSVDTTTTPGSVIISASGGTGGGDGVAGGYVAFSTFAGTSDDAKLASAVAYVAAQTYKPAVVLDENRLYTFNSAHPDPPDGWHLTGPIGSFAGNIEQSSKNSLAAKVKINYSGTWVNLSVTKWNIRFSNINFEGTANTTWLNSPTQTLWCMHLHSLSFNLFKHVIGTPTSKCLITASQIDGYWDVANGYNTAFTLGGSDNNLFMDGMLLDSGITSGVAALTPLFICDYLQKGNIGPIFATSRNNWAGILIKGSSTAGQALVMSPGARWEGKNNSEYCQGATIRIEGGSLSIFGADTMFGRGNSSNARGDQAQIHMTGGSLHVDACTYSRADGVSQDVPYIYCSGGDLTVSNIQRGTQGGGTWTDLPVVQIAGTGRLLAHDGTVRVTPQTVRQARVYSGTTAPANPQKGDLWVAGVA
jgi:hypothetical protein